MKLSRFEKTVLTWCLVLLALAVGVLIGDAAHAAPVKRYHPPGPFTLVLRFSHHASRNLDVGLMKEDERDGYVDVVDRVEQVGPIYGWDVCAGAALEAGARLQDPAHDAYVTASCLYLGRR